MSVPRVAKGVCVNVAGVVQHVRVRVAWVCHGVGVRVPRHLCRGQRVRRRAAGRAQRLGVDAAACGRDAVCSRAAHVVLADDSAPTRVRQVERGGAIASAKRGSDCSKQVRISCSAD
ncbi:hypothetical protein RSW36_25805, partial [Escherichia coli]|nr:hypothetical protein [Escherichia coli]